MKVAIASALVLSVLGLVHGHTYHLGVTCPNVEPVPNFNLDKFMGLWYVIQKSSTASNCLVNNYTRTDDGEIRLEQNSEHFLLGLGSVDHVYRYTGILKQPDRYNPAAMRVKFPLSIAGDASYIVFDTDYDTYAAVFTCQKLAIAHRRSATILSRKKTLDSAVILKLRNKLNNFGVDPHDLSIVKQDDCRTILAEDGLNINIDEKTFTAQSAAEVVRKAGEKIGDGIETVASGASKVYNKVRGNKDKDDLIEKDAEWLP
ncbi:apolipoprotein D-like [Neocloeon triangulifer]|uniref:apolipoprotein D-like n=1 Tax=Neocloeon triangulifer TaxID=2078957 RepID=UPI00286F4379|nr:apolipoprotein D-like [Neocloeon triangulifer]